jgi:hypothetical protein
MKNRLSPLKMHPERIRMLYWQNQYTADEIAKKLDISTGSVYSFMRKNKIPRRTPTDANFLISKSKPQFCLKSNLDQSDQILKIAGIMLYWAEGTFQGNTVDFANSDPAMIKLFLKFLRQICGISEERLRVYLYGYASQNVAELKNFWQLITGIPQTQFTKPYIRNDAKNQSQRKLIHGLVHIRYNDKKLLKIIKFWLDDYINVSWVGTQVAKGDRLSKGSVIPKGVMEK